MRDITLTKDMIDKVARQVSRGPMGLAHYRPEAWALPTNCFRNVARKVQESGGRGLYGWTFHHRLAEKIPGNPLYLYVTHHAVWHAPDGSLVDVTPYPDERHKPIGQDGDTLFLVDEGAAPIAVAGQPAPLPLRFFAIDESAELTRYIEELNQREKASCRELYDRAGR
jgi:hypothetical protein